MEKKISLWKVALVVAIGVALGWAIGKFTTKPRVETKTVERVVEQVVTVEVEKKVEVEVAREGKEKRVVVYRERVVNADGSTREVERQEEAEAHVVERIVEKVVDRIVKVDVDRIVERRVEVRGASPNWRLGLGLETTPTWPVDPLVRVSGSRRLVGPLFLDVVVVGNVDVVDHVTRVGAQRIGVGLSVEF